MIYNISNSVLLKPVVYLLIIGLLHLPFVGQANNTIELRAGTPISVELMQNLKSTDLSPGQTIDFRVKYDVIVKKTRLISAGSIGKGQITKVDRRKSFGKPGMLEIQVQSIQAVDGQQIPVSGIPLKIKGDSKSGLAWGLTIGLGILTIVGAITGVFIKGKAAEVPAGTTLNASIASHVEIEPGDMP